MLETCQLPWIFFQKSIQMVAKDEKMLSSILMPDEAHIYVTNKIVDYRTTLTLDDPKDIHICM